MLLIQIIFVGMFYRMLEFSPIGIAKKMVCTLVSLSFCISMYELELWPGVTNPNLATNAAKRGHDRPKNRLKLTIIRLLSVQ